MFSATSFLGRAAVTLALTAAALNANPASADDGFPFGLEMTLDVARQPGSKRIPNMEIGDSGETILELWCKGGKGQFSVPRNTVIFTAGPLSTNLCPIAQRGWWPPFARPPPRWRAFAARLGLGPPVSAAGKMPGLPIHSISRSDPPGLSGATRALTSIVSVKSSAGNSWLGRLNVNFSLPVLAFRVEDDAFAESVFASTL